MSNPLTLVRDNPLTLQVGATETISAGSNLAVTDTDYSDAQLTYTVVTAPSDGTLLDNGTPTTTFTQADLDNGLVSYHETAPYPPNANIFSDQFVFDVSDPGDNQITNAQFQIFVDPSYPVTETAPASLTVYADLTTAITGVQIAYSGYSSERFTTTVTANGGTLWTYETPMGDIHDLMFATVTGSGTSSLSITGTLSEVNAALQTLHFVGITPESDSITVTTTDLGDQASVIQNINAIVEQVGNFTSIDDTQATNTTIPAGLFAPIMTYAYGLNNAGQIVGAFSGPSLQQSVNGFIYNDGAFTTVNDPTINNDFDSETVPQSIADNGQILGYEQTAILDGEEGLNYTVQGFIYDNGTFSILGSGFFEDSNDQGMYVGYFSNNMESAPAETLNTTGFIYQNGSYQNIGPSGTAPFGISDEGEVVGTYDDQNNNAHGFTYNDGVFSLLNAPSALATDARGINDAGLIVGYYEDANGSWQGFSYNENSRIWTTIDIPGATATYVYGINNSNQIVGYYLDQDGDAHSFVGTVPPPLPTDGGNNDEWILSNGRWEASAEPGSHPAGYQVAGIGDFTESGTDGILWYNSSTGDVDEWQLSYGAWAKSVDLGSHPGNYQIAGVGDFFGNGIDDVLWTSVSGNGQVQTDIWELLNGQWRASVSPGSHPSGYQVAGVGDWTGNGTDGILWYNASTGDTDEWQLNNGQWAASVDLGGHPGTGWQITGIGSFTGNGIDDVLWTSVNSDGTVATDIWQLGSNGKWANSVSPGNHPAGYQVVGVGDFTGNGTSDILWQNATTGDVDEWLIGNGKWAGSVDLGVHPGNFQIAGVGDFTGTGTSDILWHSPT